MIRERITSAQNPRLKQVRQLQDKKARQRDSLFVIDYGRDLERALAHGYTVEFVLAAPDLLSDSDTDLLNNIESVYEVLPDLLEKAGYRQNPTGIIAVLNTPAPLPLPPALADHNAPLLLLVGLEKPGNIGALLRTADATGVAAVLLIDTALDRYNPNLIRASTGACFLPTIFEVTSAQALTFCHTNRYTIVSAHLEGSVSLYDLTLTGDCAIVLGREDSGLDTVWRDACHSLMKIPMMGQITDSLNVSVSGAVILYEALRQRLCLT